LIQQLETEAWCATIPSALTVLLLVHAICLLKNNSGEDSLSKSKVCLLFAASLLCICAYISWSATIVDFEEGLNIGLSVFLLVVSMIWSVIFLLILLDIGQLILKHQTTSHRESLMTVTAYS
jgi:hypothetical protein